jgi:hypothetical protein
LEPTIIGTDDNNDNDDNNNNNDDNDNDVCLARSDEI